MNEEMRKIRNQAYMEGKESGRLLEGLAKSREIAQKLIIAKVDLELISESCEISMDAIKLIKKRLEKENKLI